MKKVISLVLTLAMLTSVQIASAGGFGFDIANVTFGGKEFCLAVTDSTEEAFPGEKLPGDLSIIPSDEYENGEDLETLFFPATTNVTYKKASGIYHKEYRIHWVELNFSQDAKTRNVILEHGITGLMLDFASCSNLKTIVIPETVRRISLYGIPEYDSRFYTTEDARRLGYIHGQVINDNGVSTIVYVYSEVAKALGLQQEQLTEKIPVPEYNDYYLGVKTQYQTQVDAYVAQYEMSKYAKSRQDLVFYVKSGSYAEGYLRSSGFNVQQYVAVTYNGNEVYSDQPAVIVGGRTLVPLRAALEAMGATVNWNNDTRTVTSERNNTKISLAIGSNRLYVNGVAKTIDVPAQIVNGRTMVPARAVAEAFGCDVSWDNNTRTAIIKE